MAAHKGKPSGKYAETKRDPGRKADYKRTGWPEDAPTQHVANATEKQTDNQQDSEEITAGMGSGRNRKAGSPE